MNTAQLIERCYLAAKSKGFWDTERNQAEAFALVLSELNEALDAHRKGKFSCKKIDYPSLDNPIFEDLFKLRIKDTLEDELADTLIRCFDFCGGFKMDIFELNNPSQIDEHFKNATNMGEKILRLTYITSSAYYAQGSFVAIQKMYNNVIALCQELNIDIETHINLKLAYNATREKLHGKNY